MLAVRVNVGVVAAYGRAANATARTARSLRGITGDYRKGAEYNAPHKRANP